MDRCEQTQKGAGVCFLVTLDISSTGAVNPQPKLTLSSGHAAYQRHDKTACKLTKPRQVHGGSHLILSVFDEYHKAHAC